MRRKIRRAPHLRRSGSCYAQAGRDCEHHRGGAEPADLRRAGQYAVSESWRQSTSIGQTLTARSLKAGSSSTRAALMCGSPRLARRFLPDGLGPATVFAPQRETNQPDNNSWDAAYKPSWGHGRSSVADEGPDGAKGNNRERDEIREYCVHASRPSIVGESPVEASSLSFTEFFPDPRGIAFAHLMRFEHLLLRSQAR